MQDIIYDTVSDRCLSKLFKYIGTYILKFQFNYFLNLSINSLQYKCKIFSINFVFIIIYMYA